MPQPQNLNHLLSHSPVVLLLESKAKDKRTTTALLQCAAMCSLEKKSKRKKKEKEKNELKRS